MKYVLYHANCWDGFGAAWAAQKVLGREGVEYLPVLYGQPPPPLPDAEHVYIVDFSYPREVLLALTAKQVLVIDHHASAQKDLRDVSPFDELAAGKTAVVAWFDMEQSGATMTWKYFHSDEPPLLLKYVEDRDLWRFALPDSREISAWFRSYPHDFAQWDDLRELLSEHFLDCVHEGQAILRQQDRMVEDMAKQAIMIQLGGHRVPCCNATTYYSEVGDLLCRQHPDAHFAAYYMDRADGKRQWGLRSRGDFDCSEIAKMYGGGGHKGAAGFTTDAPLILSDRRA